MRFGILGDAKIARERLRPAILNAGHEVVAIGRRDETMSLSPIWGDIPSSSYEAVLNNPNVDAVYIPLPNHLHVPYAIKALEAGKAVLCEKPVALSLSEFDELQAAVQRSNQYLYDGYMVRFHPQWHWLKKLDIGTRLTMQAHFSYPPQAEGNIRNVASWGGGPIWDIGCYCLLSALMLFDGRPELLSLIKTSNPQLDIEQSASAMIKFEGGASGACQILNMTCSREMALSQSLHLVGTDGWAKLDVPFNAPPQATARFAHSSHGKDQMLGLGQAITFEPCDQYQLMVEDFVVAVDEGRRTDLSQSYHLTRLLSEMVQAPMTS